MPRTRTARSCHRPVFRYSAVPTRRPAVVPARFGEDDLLRLLLVSTWELRTARPVPAQPPLPFAEMTEDELIEFWSDPADQPCPPGCPAPHPTRRPGTNDPSPAGTLGMTGGGTETEADPA